MDKKRVREYRKLQMSMQNIQKDYTEAFLSAIETDDEENIHALEEKHASLCVEIQKLKKILDDSFAMDEHEIKKTTRP